MTSIIQLISNKSDWRIKCQNKTIVSKWKKEIVNQGGNANYIDLTISVLKSIMENNPDTYQSDLSPNLKWHLNYTISSRDLVWNCPCKCPNCLDAKLIRDLLTPEEEEEFEKLDWNGNDTGFNCICMINNIAKKARHSFLKVHTFRKYDKNNKFRKTLFNQITKFKNSIEPDWHPNSNGTVLDIVHPSLYCYVQGITKPIQDKEIIFAWLPSEFNISQSGKVKIDSYINNLPEENTDLYQSIAKLFEEMIPDFQNLLNVMVENEKYLSQDSPVPNLNGSNLHVIVKIAETILTPTNPKFNGGSWHLEGTYHENIIATGIYYYRIKNISPNFLKFRSCVDNDFDYPQGGEKYVKDHYGLKHIDEDNYNSTETKINLPKIETKEGLRLIFPNYIQHCVSPFELDDKTKEGSRSIIAFFLIDPTKQILSTKNVPKQQSSMTFEDAKIYREMLMYHRQNERQIQDTVYTRGFSLCEH